MMPTPDLRTTEDLQAEVGALRARVAELEAWNAAAERAAEALQKSGESFRLVFDQSNDAIFILSPDEDRFVDVNPRATQLLGYTAEELRALPVTSIHAHEVPALRAFASEVTHRGAGMTTALSFATKSGERVPAEISASMVDLGARRYMVAMVRDIRDRRRAEETLRRAHRRMEADLDAAAQMQRALLPHESPRIPGLRTAWHVKPSERLAGDTLNIFRLDDRHVGFYLLDVSGHGVKAAMLSVTLHRMLSPYPGALSALFDPGPDGWQIVAPPRVIGRLNGMFQMADNHGQYFTIFYGVLDLETRRLRFVSAGQGAPILVDASGTMCEIERYDLPVGVQQGVRFEGHEMELPPGGTLYVYSDGMVETFDVANEPFGKERLMAAIAANRDKRLGEGLLDLVERVDRHGCAECVRDDMSVLAIQLK
jgi:sigma-B regulation protein RsbU (phosphoserine phosphatase)